MNIRRLLRIGIFFFLVTGLMEVSLPKGHAASATAAGQPHILIRINDLEGLLGRIDTVAAKSPELAMISSSAMIRAMLMGPEWLDADRAIVIGIRLNDPQPVMGAFVPYRRPNDAFQTAYNAIDGPDYYVVSLPPGQGAPIGDEFTQSLIAAASSAVTSSVSAEILVRDLLDSHRSKLVQMIQQLPEPDPVDPLEQPAPPIAPAELKASFIKALDLFAQIERLTIGIDMDLQILSFAYALQAVPKSQLANIIQSADNTSTMHGYNPQHHFTWHQRSFDVAGMLALFLPAMQDLYAAMGLDLQSFVDLADRFSGEYAGGFSFTREGSRFEMMALLKAADDTENFAESVIVPFMVDKGRDMAREIASQSGQVITPLYVRTADSNVAGLKVVGLKLQPPTVTAGTGNAPPFQNTPMELEMRMTTVNDVLLASFSDARLAELVEIAKSLKPESATGPLMAGEMDLGAYLNAIREMMPPGEVSVPPVPPLGRISYQADVEELEFWTRISLPVEDLSALMAWGKQAGAMMSMTQGQPSPGKSVPPNRNSSISEVKAHSEVSSEPPTQVRDAPYWFDRGALCAVYGNDRAAIRNFKKALELDPTSAETHFQMGISYGGLGEFGRAMEHFDRAMVLGISKGRYHYGRGWVLLLQGEQQLAMDDLDAAAVLEYPDAQRYLQNRTER